MKIVQVQTQAEAAGAQRISEMLGDCLRARGHEVRTVFMYRKTEAYDRDPFADFVLRERPRGPFDQLRASVGLFGYLRAARPDAVISFQHYGNIFGTLGARLAGARHVIANQSGEPQKRGLRGIASWIDRQMGRFGLYQLNVVNSAWTEAQFASYPAAYRERIRRIDHGVEGAGQRYDKAAARLAFGLPADAFLILTSGRQTAGKNQIALLRAVSGLPDAHLALAGIGPEAAALKAGAAAAGLAGRVHFLGEIAPARMPELLAAGDMFGFPSRFETFGLSAVEAAVAGLPIVANDIAVLREVLTGPEGEPAALFADADDGKAFAGAIARLMAEPQLAERLAQAGRRLAERYSPEAMARAYEALLAGP